MISRITKFIFIVILFTTYTFPQTTYYNGTENLSGTALKSVLHNIIKNHKRYPYSSSSTDTWDILKETEKDPNNGANLILIYSGNSVNAAQEYNGGNGWNREHVWAKSHGFPNESDTAYTDVNHLRPSLESVNSDRGNKDFDNGGSAYSAIPGTFTDSDSWEPRDDVKGDVARAMFYMTVRYEGPNYDLELVDYTGTPNQAIFGKLSTLLEWNRLDPPSDFERNRNDVVQSFQQNRNPFIDRPEFVDLIYKADKFILTRAEAISYNQVLLTFNKEVELNSAQNPQNYYIDKSIGNPISASRLNGTNSNKVALTLASNLDENQTFIVKVNNVKSADNSTIISNSLASLKADVFVPVELTSFTANVSKSKVMLNWKTSTETNNYGFEILRSTNNENLNWQKIGFVQGNGTTTDINSYSFIDENLKSGKYAYKLKQIDFDGNSKFSDVVNIEINAPVKYALDQNYPNPFNPTTVISYSIPNDEFTSLKVYDLLGNQIATLVNEQKSAGSYKVTFDASNLPSGIYFYSLSAGNFKQVKKMMLTK